MIEVPHSFDQKAHIRPQRHLLPVGGFKSGACLFGDIDVRILFGLLHTELPNLDVRDALLPVIHFRAIAHIVVQMQPIKAGRVGNRKRRLGHASGFHIRCRLLIHHFQQRIRSPDYGTCEFLFVHATPPFDQGIIMNAVLYDSIVSFRVVLWKGWD